VGRAISVRLGQPAHRNGPTQFLDESPSIHGENVRGSTWAAAGLWWTLQLDGLRIFSTAWLQEIQPVDAAICSNPEEEVIELVYFAQHDVGDTGSPYATTAFDDASS